MKFQKIVIIVLAILLVSSLGYIALDKYRVKQASIYQKGLQDGFQQMLTYMFQQASTCRQVPLTVQNQTINLIAVECQKAG